MATVDMDKVNKVYENGFHAVKDLSLDVGEGEFMVLVGPSGCGKTTALRMVAGLEDITSGLLRIGGKVVNDETPKDRDIAMVFQNYALYPHMTVRDNIGFALKLRSGVLQQVDHPQHLYDRPDNLFVAAFIGSPAMNLYEASMTEDASAVRIGSQELALPVICRDSHPGLARFAGKKIIVGLRPEHLPAATDGDSGAHLTGNVDLVEALGSELVVHFTIDARRVRAEGATSDDEDATAQSGEGVARVDPGTRVKAGDKITFAVTTTGMQFFDPETERAIWN